MDIFLKSLILLISNTNQDLTGVNMDQRDGFPVHREQEGAFMSNQESWIEYQYDIQYHMNKITIQFSSLFSSVSSVVIRGVYLLQDLSLQTTKNESWYGPCDDLPFWKDGHIASAALFHQALSERFKWSQWSVNFQKK